MYTVEQQAKIAVFRQKLTEGTITVQEMREATELLRAGRKSAATASDSSRRTKAKAVIQSADEMLNELGGI
jgi:hypothetical protein